MPENSPLFSMLWCFLMWVQNGEESESSERSWLGKEKRQPTTFTRFLFPLLRYGRNEVLGFLSNRIYEAQFHFRSNQWNESTSFSARSRRRRSFRPSWIQWSQTRRLSSWSAMCSCVGSCHQGRSGTDHFRCQNWLAGGLPSPSCPSVALPSEFDCRCSIVFLQLNQRGTKLLYRDKRHALHLFDMPTQQHTTLLPWSVLFLFVVSSLCCHHIPSTFVVLCFLSVSPPLRCNYVQWVPDSDVVVAQNRGNLCVWYNIDNPDQPTIVQIKGDVQDIERTHGRTEVLVDEGLNRINYALDESLINFGSAVDDHDFERYLSCLLSFHLLHLFYRPFSRSLSSLSLFHLTVVPAPCCSAVEILEMAGLQSSETDAMWARLSALALKANDYRVAERCVLLSFLWCFCLAPSRTSCSWCAGARLLWAMFKRLDTCMYWTRNRSRLLKIFTPMAAIIMRCKHALHCWTNNSNGQKPSTSSRFGHAFLFDDPDGSYTLPCCPWSSFCG